jgi:hypothetical protein
MEDSNIKWFVHIVYYRLKVLCKWIGTAERVVFEYPYIIAFDPGFIEIHHAETVS